MTRDQLKVNALICACSILLGPLMGYVFGNPISVGYIVGGLLGVVMMYFFCRTDVQG